METDFQEKLPFETHSRKNLPHVAILKNFKVFSKKNHLVFRKTKTNFERFENSYYSSRILRANLLQFSEKKISRSETWTNIVLV